MIGMYKNAKFLLEATPWIAPSRPWFGQKWPARDWTSSSRTRRVRRRCKGTKEGRLNYFTGVSIACPSLPHPIYPLLYWLPRIIPALEKRLNFVAGFRICWLPSPLWLLAGRIVHDHSRRQRTFFNYNSRKSRSLLECPGSLEAAPLWGIILGWENWCQLLLPTFYNWYKFGWLWTNRLYGIEAFWFLLIGVLNNNLIWRSRSVCISSPPCVYLVSPVSPVPGSCRRNFSHRCPPSVTVGAGGLVNGIFDFFVRFFKLILIKFPSLLWPKKLLSVWRIIPWSWSSNECWGFGQHLLLSLNIQDPSNQALIGLGFTSPKYMGSE